MVNKRVWNAVLGCNLKNDRIISVHFQGKPFNITVIQVYAPTSNVQVEVAQFYEDLQDLLELTPKKRCPFHYGGWNAKTGSQDTWSNWQVWPWSTKWSRVKANRVFPRECTGHNKQPFPTTQDWLYTWTSPSGHWNRLIIFFAAKHDWSSIWSAKTRLGADCDSENELLIAKFQVILKKIRESH